ncbi:hypothetical protein MA16_Dca013701 [Dendrobium catenatum]|uniref:Uncharacterized protein n=1 Tax=Dendrobium catenatum TaxID=906689 RepID=A0A2I0WPI7_9ASPA|nr:hypothetical protein MA16_Dca013701 [Dendrobium catenatum]
MALSTGKTNRHIKSQEKATVHSRYRNPKRHSKAQGKPRNQQVSTGIQEVFHGSAVTHFTGEKEGKLQQFKRESRRGRGKFHSPKSLHTSIN